VADNTVEITNVQGPRGVASEATLLMLLDSMKSLTGNNGQSAKVQDLYTKSVKASTKEGKGLADRLKNLGGVAADVTKAFATGARRSQQFAEAVAGGSTRLTRFFGYMDDNIDMFRALSSVGASFNNSMLDMISASANSAMEMGDFTQFVRGNADSIRLLSGTVSQGAMAFGEFSKNLRNSDTGYQLMTMGFTIEDLNDGLVSYIDLQTNLGRREMLRTTNVGAATAEYLEDLDALAKVTGKSREELASLTRQVSTDARVRALAARAEGDGATNLTKNLALAAGAVPGMSEAFMNLASGLPVDELSKALLTGAGESGRALAELLGNADNLDIDEFTNEFTRLAPQVADFLQESYSPQRIAAMQLQGGVTGAIAQLAGFGAQLDRTAMMDMKAAREEARRTNRITGIFGNFENAIISARRFLVDTFLDSKLSSALQSLGETLGNMISGVGGGTFAGFGAGLKDALATVLDTLGGFVQWVNDDLNSPESVIRKGIKDFGDRLQVAANSVRDWFTTFQQDVENNGLMNTIKARFLSLADNIKEYLKDIFLGKVVDRDKDFGNDTRSGGLLKTITDSLTNMLAKATDYFVETLGLDGESTVPLYTQFAHKIFGTDVTSDVPIYDQLLEKVFGQGGEDGSDTTVLQRIANAFDTFLKNNTVINAMKDSVTEMTNTALDTVETQLRNILGMSEGETFQQKINSMVENLTNKIIDIFEQRIPQLINTAINSTKEAVSNTVDEVMSGKAGMNLSDPDAESAMQTFIQGGDLDPETRGDLIRTLRDEVQNRSMEAGGLDYVMGSIGKGASLMTDWIEGTGFDLDNAVTSDKSLRETIEGLFPDLVASTPQMSRGTNGFADFGSATLATLHGAEAVVPRNTPAGELLQAFYDSQTGGAGSEATMSPTANQSVLTEKLNELNTSMKMMVDLMAAQNRTSGKQLQAVRATGTDLFRSTGR
jgi:hypothetical protein